MKCAFVGCGLLRSEKTQNSNISFHRIPRNENRKRLWLEAIGTENIRPNVKDIFLCSLHFDESAINKTLANKRLRDDAVPTLFAKPSGRRCGIFNTTAKKSKLYAYIRFYGRDADV